MGTGLLMTEKSFSLEESAEIICGAKGDPELYWLAQRLRGNAQPFLPGYKVQRRWRMTESQIAEALRLLEPARPMVPEVPMPSSLMRRSRRKLA